MPGLKKILLFAGPCLCFFAGCSFRSLALHSTSEILDAGKAAYYDEADPELAKEAMASQLKLLEVLLKNEPDDKRLNALAAESFGGYSFLFIEDSQPQRAKAFYLRSRDYALKALGPQWLALSQKPLDDFELALATSQKADVPALFWAAFSWAGLINLSRDTPAAVAEMPKAVALMKRSQELDASYDFAGADLFFAVYFASRPKILGGDTAKAEELFAEAQRLTGGQYLMIYLLEAKTLAVAMQDRARFQTLLDKVRDSPAGILPGSRLADETAKLKAEALRGKIDELF